MANVQAAPSPGRHMTGVVGDHKVLSANQVVIMIGNVAVGRAQSMNFRESLGTEPVMEIGSMMPAEHIPNRFQGSLTLQRYRLRREVVTQLGLAGSDEAVLKSKMFDVVVKNSDGAMVEKFVGCTPSDTSGDFQANRAATRGHTFFYMQRVNG